MRPRRDGCSTFKAGVIAGLVIALAGCSGGGATGSSWSFTMSSAAWFWPPARTVAQSPPAPGQLPALAGRLLDLLFHAQPAYAAANGGNFTSSVTPSGSFSGSFSNTGQGGCILTETVSGSFSGTSMTFTISGGGCGLTINGSGNGTMDLAWPNSTTVSGSYNITITGGLCPNCSGTFSARKM